MLLIIAVDRLEKIMIGEIIEYLWGYLLPLFVDSAQIIEIGVFVGYLFALL